MFFNFSYLLFMLPGLILSLWASAKVKSTFAKYNRVPLRGGLTAAQAARQILDGNGLYSVRIERVQGNLSDHYDPRSNIVRLSDSTFSSSSVAAVGVAAHEVGHAIQHAAHYGPASLRSAIVPVANIGSGAAVPLILIGLFLNMVGLIYLGIILFSLAVLFQLVTLPVEFNASRRALQTLNDTGMVTSEESAGVSKVLSAAALTYVAALLSSLLQLVYFITLAGGRRR